MPRRGTVHRSGQQSTCVDRSSVHLISLAGRSAVFCLFEAAIPAFGRPLLQEGTHFRLFSILLFCCDGFSISLGKYVRKMNTDKDFSASLEMTMALNANSL